MQIEIVRVFPEYQTLDNESKLKILDQVEKWILNERKEINEIVKD